MLSYSIVIFITLFPTSRYYQNSIMYEWLLSGQLVRISSYSLSVMNNITELLASNQWVGKLTKEYSPSTLTVVCVRPDSTCQRPPRRLFHVPIYLLVRKPRSKSWSVQKLLLAESCFSSFTVAGTVDTRWQIAINRENPEIFLGDMRATPITFWHYPKSCCLSSKYLVPMHVGFQLIEFYLSVIDSFLCFNRCPQSSQRVSAASVVIRPLHLGHGLALESGWTSSLNVVS